MKQPQGKEKVFFFSVLWGSFFLIAAYFLSMDFTVNQNLKKLSEIFNFMSLDVG